MMYSDTAEITENLEILNEIHLKFQIHPFRPIRKYRLFIPVTFLKVLTAN